MRTAAGQHRRACDTSRDLARGTRMPRRSSIVWPEGPDTRLLSSSLSPFFVRIQRSHKGGGDTCGPRGVYSLRFVVVVSLSLPLPLSLRICRARTTATVAESERASRTVIIHSREPNIRRHTFASVSYRWTRPVTFGFYRIPIRALLRYFDEFATNSA